MTGSVIGYGDVDREGVTVGSGDASATVGSGVASFAEKLV